MNPTKRQKRTRPQAAGNKVTTSSRVSDALWAVLAAVVPAQQNTHRFGGGRPQVPDRQCADALFYVSRTGCQWGALEATDLCPHPTAHDRFQEWVAAGVFQELWQAGVEQFAELQGRDWRGLSMEGAMAKAPRGGKSPGPLPRLAPKGASSAVC
jgi:putative transposase